MRFEYDWAREPFKICRCSALCHREATAKSLEVHGPAVASHTYRILWHIDLQNNHLPIGSVDDIRSIFMHFPLLIMLVVASVSRAYHVPDACDQL